MSKSGRVLVVEDEWLIAHEVSECLEEAGHQVVGPVSSVQKALPYISGNLLDAALLDIRLNGEDSYPLAEALAERHIRLPS
jgi:DNA-binding response OmpR family regulator